MNKTVEINGMKAEEMAIIASENAKVDEELAIKKETNRKNKVMKPVVKENVESLKTKVASIRPKGITLDGIQYIKNKEHEIVGYKKDYHLLNPHSGKDEITVYSPYIIQRTEIIHKALHGNKLFDKVVCRELANMNEEQYLQSMNMKSIVEYGSAFFDLSKVTTLQYARIGRVFLDDEYNCKIEGLPSNLTKGHFVELLSYLDKEDENTDWIVSKYMDGTLTSDMSCIALRKALKKAKKDEMAIEVEGKEIENGKTNNDGNENGNNEKQLNSDSRTDGSDTNISKGANDNNESNGNSKVSDSNTGISDSDTSNDKTIIIEPSLKGKHGNELNQLLFGRILNRNTEILNYISKMEFEGESKEELDAFYNKLHATFIAYSDKLFNEFISKNQ